MSPLGGLKMGSDQDREEIFFYVDFHPMVTVKDIQKTLSFSTTKINDTPMEEDYETILEDLEHTPPKEHHYKCPLCGYKLSLFSDGMYHCRNMYTRMDVIRVKGKKRKILRFRCTWQGSREIVEGIKEERLFYDG